jgi:hypothetical protein
MSLLEITMNLFLKDENITITDGLITMDSILA